MKSLAFRLALLVGCVATAACSQTTESSRFQFAPTVHGVVHRAARPLSYSILYSFRLGRDGAQPVARLIDVGGRFYSTTFAGGKYCYRSGGCGTVFSVTGGGVEKVLHDFGKGSDGGYPLTALIDVKGTLYGTTTSGGAYGCGTECGGTFFSITTGGNEKVLYSFGSGTDGNDPRADLLDVKGTLYGTTFGGGKYCHGSLNCGTVFSITTNGTEQVLHSFGNAGDGSAPDAGLIDAGGTFYGTTFVGGAHACGSTGCGTVFSITPSGAEKVLYSFTGGSDGEGPEGSLLDVGGTLYGTTSYGGTYGGGTFYSVTTSGVEKVLYSFGNGNDGYIPNSRLINVGGLLYGTTYDGGGTGGFGTVFRITRGGAENVLHGFGYGSDGSGPAGGLIYKNGSLFGVTQGGGGLDRSGTVYTLTP